MFCRPFPCSCYVLPIAICLRSLALRRTRTTCQTDSDANAPSVSKMTGQSQKSRRKASRGAHPPVNGGIQRRKHTGAGRICAPAAVESHHPFPEHQQVSSGVVFRRSERTSLVRPPRKASASFFAVPSSRPPMHGINIAGQTNRAANGLPQTVSPATCFPARVFLPNR